MQQTEGHLSNKQGVQPIDEDEADYDANRGGHSASEQDSEMDDFIVPDSDNENDLMIEYVDAAAPGDDNEEEFAIREILQQASDHTIAGYRIVDGTRRSTRNRIAPTRYHDPDWLTLMMEGADAEHVMQPLDADDEILSADEMEFTDDEETLE